jgi:signal transduction histidine kinase
MQNPNAGLTSLAPAMYVSCEVMLASPSTALPGLPRGAGRSRGHETPATILVVEDEPIIASDIRQTLRCLGFKVPHSVSTGRQAIDTAERLRPQLVLMDITLKGGMDGVTAATEIRDRFGIPFVYLTSRSDDASLTRAAATRPDGYVLKPFSERDLGLTIDVALRKHGIPSAGDLTAIHGQDGQPVDVLDGEVPVAKGERDLRTEREHLAQGKRFASLGRMAAVLLREINNPLANLLLNVAFCVEGIGRIGLNVQNMQGAGVADARASTFGGAMDGLRSLEAALGDASEGADRIRRIVRALTGFARAEESDGQPTDLSMVLDNATEVAAQAMKSLPPIRKEYGDTPRVDGNAGPLAQVFTNLLVNAADAIALGGGVDGEIRISMFTDTGGRAVVAIHDNGAGISPEALPRIFDPFFSTKAKNEGTGLGLSICRCILDSYGGEITAQSGAEGTTFRVALPAAYTRCPKGEDAIAPPGTGWD